MYDIPLIFNEGKPVGTTKTIIMYIGELTSARNFGVASAASVVLFVVTLIISLLFFKILGDDKEIDKNKKSKPKFAKKN